MDQFIRHTYTRCTILQAIKKKISAIAEKFGQLNAYNIVEQQPRNVTTF